MLKDFVQQQEKVCRDVVISKLFQIVFTKENSHTNQMHWKKKLEIIGFLGSAAPALEIGLLEFIIFFGLGLVKWLPTIFLAIL